MTKARVITVLALMLLAAPLRTDGRQADARPLYRLSLPEKSWALDLDLTAFNVPEGSAPANAGKGSKPRHVPTPVEFLSDDGREYQLAVIGRVEVKSSWGLHIKMVPAMNGAGAEAFRAARLKELGGRRGLDVGGVKTWEYKQIPVARFASQHIIDYNPMLGGPPSALGPKLRMIEAYFVKEGVGITLRLILDDFGEREEKFFYALLDSVRFADTSAPSTSFDYFHKGRLLLLRKDYRPASQALAAALNLERNERRLDVATWRDLLQMSMIAYARAGEIARAKEVLDYAAASDPANPTFQIWLARFAASSGDLEQTVAHLEKAFRLHATSGQATPLPDPLHDRTFERFWKDERFKKAVKALKK